MRLNGIFKLMISAILICAGSGVLHASEIGDIINDIRNADKVQRLYTVRYNLNSIRERGGLSLGEKRELLNAYQMLTESFKRWNHFRNADIVYIDYLEILDEYHNNYSRFLVDSVHNANTKEIESLRNKSAELDKEVDVLEAKQKVISGMKSNYMTFSVIATIIILVVFLVIFIRKTKAINEAKATISKNRDRVKELFTTKVQSSMARGAIAYSKGASQQCITGIDDLASYFKMDTDPKAAGTAQTSLNDYRAFLEKNL